MKIAAIQLNVVLGDVTTNLKKVENYIIQAANSGAELVLLPEFFSSAIGFTPKMLDVAIKNNNVSIFLQRLSKRYHIIIGGSYLKFNGAHTHNQFELIFPTGELFVHKKDIPTQFENCYYTNGDDNHILNTPIGNIGVALCWEMLRYDTLKRLSKKVDIVLCGSCWWDLPKEAPSEREPLRKYNQKLALETPVTFAKLIHVPVIHASHCGAIISFNFPKEDALQTRQFVGGTQIIDKDGNIIARRKFDEGEGILLENISYETTNHKSADLLDDRYWIPNLPESYIHAWETINPMAKIYYENVSLPYYKNNSIKA